MKRCAKVLHVVHAPQPPSGGCVLKLFNVTGRHLAGKPAAFGRLCVETVGLAQVNKQHFPAAFGRLCVET